MQSDADLFAEALQRPLIERSDFLKTASCDDAQRARIETLLRAHERVSEVWPAPVRVRPEAAAPSAATVIGRFKLLEKIGEGGCGVVWMAQQEQPVRRRVALKVIKLGMDTKEVIARFEAERQALALMNHPNIARVFEAGATETGRPYFAMELVRGLPITRYCDERKLNTTERLTLFVQVCRALQHAHEKGIVHRDIKPSNILVTHDGDAPMPKVIDFGIAKATEGRLTDRTLFTAFEQFIGTPAYMSPEQADFHAQEIDARSDVYSLGALFYELLAGRPPFDPKSLASAGIDEVRRIIREVDPPRPSTQLHTLSHAERTTLALRRGLAPAEHALAVKGDLDRIAMKALEKNRARRYESAAAFAADVQRHLEHKPIFARAPSVTYILQKFIRRHRLVVAAGAAVSAALIVGASISVWQARRAVRAEKEHAELAAKTRGSPLVQLIESGNVARPAPSDPASSVALARAREFVADVRENYFHDSLLEPREDHVQERADETLAALDFVAADARWPEWARDRGIVSARRALAERRRARPTAMAHAEAARAELEALRTAGDTSDDATVLLAMAYATAFDPIMQQRLYGHPEARKRTEAFQLAEKLLLPLVLGERSANRARHVLAEILLARGEHKDGGEAETGFLRRALALVDDIDATERSQPRVLLTRAKIVSQIGAASTAEENERRQREAMEIADAVLAQQPRSARAQRIKFWANYSLGWTRANVPVNAAALGEAEKLAFALHKRDSTSDDDWYLLLVARRALAAKFVEEGRIADAAAVWHQTTVDGGHPATQLEPAEGGARRFIKGVLLSTAMLEASRGNAEVAELAFRAQQPHALGARVGPDATQRAALAQNALGDTRSTAQFKLLRGDYDWVIVNCRGMLDQLTPMLIGPAAKEADRVLFRAVVETFREVFAEALIHRGRFAEAEMMLRVTSEMPPAKQPRYNTTHQIWLALAMARQDHGIEALETLAETTSHLRRKHESGSATHDQRELLARAMFVEAIAQPPTEGGRARRQTAIAEAQKILDAMTAESRQLYNQRVLLKWIAEERSRG
jgi:serine/threonine protein kinase